RRRGLDDRAEICGQHPAGRRHLPELYDDAVQLGAAAARERERVPELFEQPTREVQPVWHPLKHGVELHRALDRLAEAEPREPRDPLQVAELPGRSLCGARRYLQAATEPVKVECGRER